MNKIKHFMILILAMAVSVSFISLTSFGQEKTKEGYAGTEICKGCHLDLYEALKKGPHGEKDCESCHGPGQKHAEAEGKGMIFSFKEGDAVVRSDTCLKCHQKQKEVFQFRRGVHKLSAVACNDCHGVHGSQMRESLLKKKEPDLCFSCHQEVRGQFSLPVRHKVLEGAVKCTDCHTPHGTRARANLRTWNKFNVDACFKCHPEKRGPWVFEHTAVKVEGCTICHVSHGSANRFLLNARDPRRVCIQCHGQHHANPSSCVTCHSQIHGSNFNDRFLQ